MLLHLEDHHTLYFNLILTLIMLQIRKYLQHDGFLQPDDEFLLQDDEFLQ